MASPNPTSSPAPEVQPQGELTQLQVSQQILAELRALNKSLAFLTQRVDVSHSSVMTELRQVRSLLDGFTSGGASFNAYQVDQLTAAYLAIIGPLVAARLAAPGQPTDLPQVLKGAVLMAKTLTEELAAYRSQRQSFDYLESQTEFINDPWKQQGQS
jgi:hypothetical protein